MSLSQINESRKSIKDLAYQKIKEAIIRGDLLPGEQLTEEDLAQSLGISRTPLREAINILMRESWILKDKSRIRVAPITQSEINNLFLMREYLEGLAIRQATENLTDGFLSELSKVMESMRKAEEENNTNQIVHHGMEFHQLIIQQGNNPLLTEMLGSVLEKIKRYRHLGVNTISNRPQSAVAEHYKMIEEIKSGDPDRAEKAMRDHIKSSHNSIILSDKGGGN